MRVLGVVIAAALLVSMPMMVAPRGAHAEEERVGQDPDVPGGAVPGTPSDTAPEERVGQDSDVPGGSAPGTPSDTAPLERVGQDPDVPGGEEPGTPEDD